MNVKAHAPFYEAAFNARLASRLLCRLVTTLHKVSSDFLGRSDR
jgi:hypothetical protein